MKIDIRGLQDERFKRPLELICALFYEEVDVSLTKREDAVMTIDINLEIGAAAIAHAKVMEHVTKKEGTASYERTISSYTEEKEKFKHVKSVVSYVVVAALQELTGMEQKWGILTGIRPTKIVHKKRQQGMTNEEIYAQLKADYLIADEKIDLMNRIVDRQLAVVPDLYEVKNEVSIYIGIPFCPTKCAYCTFPAYAIKGHQSLVGGFLDGLHFEIQQIGKFLKEKGMKITTVYFGGGTPTSITAEEMDALYEEMYRSFPEVDKVREVTVEAGRPDTITPEKLEVLKKWKIDRISVNPQSYNQETLKAIGRHHTVEETVTKFKLSRDMGMNNINMDLIIGLPGEGVDIFQHTLEETEKLMPESLTVHTLSFKRASEMTQNKQKYKVAGREEVIEMMDMASAWTEKHNYAPYYLYRQKNILGNLENVGYALEGQDSIYNIMIMEEVQSIIGLGCGASSKFVHPETGKIERFANPKDPKSYNEGFERYTETKLKILEELYK
jgi:oxygen-independent coproporphyrinogen III oxidase